jgi:23S rRNA (adenine2030-N6)-methyltransferase
VNYRHSFHAGNFGDCVKHALLLALLRALLKKPAPLFVLDSHAGAGRYDLTGEPARRTNEAVGGILRLLDGVPPSTRHVSTCDVSTHDASTHDASTRDAATHDAGTRHGPARPGHLYQHGVAIAGPGEAPPRLGEGREPGAGACNSQDPLADYVATVRRLGLYPGSPALIRSLLRGDDRLACCEAHPEDCARLRMLFRHDRQVAVHQRDGWEALKALLPPVQKRGLVLIDPPYEDPREFGRLTEGLTMAHARFPTGVLAAWYPVKHRAPVRAFFSALALRDVIAAELLLREPLDPARLNGCGLLIVNPPYRFEQQAQMILDALLSCLGDREPGAAASVTRLADE